MSIEALSASRHDLIQPRIGWAGTRVAVLLFAAGVVVAVGTLVDRSSHDAWTLILFGIGGGALGRTGWIDDRGAWGPTADPEAIDRRGEPHSANAADDTVI